MRRYPYSNMPTLSGATRNVVLEAQEYNVDK